MANATIELPSDVSTHQQVSTSTLESSSLTANTVTATSILSDASSSDDNFKFPCAVLVIGVIGTFANGFVLFVLGASQQLKQHLMNYLVFNQLALDLFSSATLVVTYAVSVAQVYLTGSTGYWLCIVLLSEMVLFVGLNGSMLNLAFIAIERYVKIVHPIWHKKRFRPRMAYAAIGATWLAGMLTNVIYVPLTSAVVDGQCLAVVFWASRAAQAAYGIWYFVTFFAFPLTSFAYCYGRILGVIVHRRKRIGTLPIHAGHQLPPSNAHHTSTMKTDEHSERMQMQAVKTMVILTAFFVVSWLPNHVYYLMLNIDADLTLLNDGWYVTLFIGFFNICANPFIYAFKSPLVRRYVAGLCVRLKCETNENIPARDDGGQVIGQNCHLQQQQQQQQQQKPIGPEGTTSKAADGISAVSATKF